MNNFKKTGGFTLVELIVVIAILGILAAVAIPAYSGYITKSKDAAAITELDAIATAAQAANAKAGAIKTITVTTNKITVASDNNLADDFDDNFEMFYGVASGDTDSATKTVDITMSKNVLAGSSYETSGAKWSAGKWDKNS